MDPVPNNQDVFFGNPDAGTGLKQWLATGGYARILFVTGQESFHRSGAGKFLREAIGTDFEFRFSAFEPNPTYDDVLRGLEYFHSVRPDCIVAVGGGSAMDMAKLINFFGSNRVSPPEYLRHAREIEGAVSLPCVAVPTTAGSGSEATGFAVLYKNRKKYSVEHPCMLPNLAVINPGLTLSMSPFQTACCGFDAFSQAVESYWAVGSTAVSRQYSSMAISRCIAHLEGAVLAPSTGHRTGMMEAAHLAGKAINIAKTTAAHALSYTLTAHYGLPHGYAVAMMLPWVLEMNAAVAEDNINDPRGVEHVRDSVHELCVLLGCDSAQAASKRIQGITDSIGLTGKWRSMKALDLEEVRRHVVRDVNEGRLGNNPRMLNQETVKWIAMHIQ